MIMILTGTDISVMQKSLAYFLLLKKIAGFPLMSDVYNDPEAKSINISRIYGDVSFIVVNVTGVEGG